MEQKTVKFIFNKFSHPKKKLFNYLELNENDVFLVSYPRSGNTWVRVILSYILYPERKIESLSELDSLIPDIHRSIPKLRYSNPRVIKSHQSYDSRHGHQNPNLYKKIIYIVRNPYDSLKSYYSFQELSKNTHYTSFEDFVQQICEGLIRTI